MNIIKYPSKEEWGALLERPHRDASELRETVQTVLDQIQQYGDSAVKAFEEKFDKVRLESLAVSEEEIAEAEGLVSDDLKREGGDCSWCGVLAEVGRYREGGFVHPRRYGTAVLYGVDVGYACQDCGV